MSCFDTVHFTCPSCKRPIEAQSKSGPCRLRDYSADQVPFSVIDGIDRRLHCECGKTYWIDPVTRFVRIELREEPPGRTEDPFDDYDYGD